MPSLDMFTTMDTRTQTVTEITEKPALLALFPKDEFKSFKTFCLMPSLLLKYQCLRSKVTQHRLFTQILFHR